MNATETAERIVEAIDNFVWGVPLIVLILAAGIVLTVRMRGLNVRHLGLALKSMVKNEDGGEGEISSFGALCTALSATIGTGNIVGVATAIAAGGPGALFWMLVAAFFGMATKYAEGFLAIKYRTIDENNHVLGGPFYYIERGLGKRWKWLAKLFAFFGVCAGLLGIGTITQINGISSAVQTFFDPERANTVMIFGHEYTWVVVITSIVAAVLVGLVIIGGVKRISGVSSVIVPFMAVAYVLFVVILILCNITRLPSAVATVVQSAFGYGDGAAAVRSAAGGILGAMIASIKNGVARGIFSNEAGLGSAPIAAAAAKTKEPVKQGLVTMTGTFIDTIVICTMTGLAIVLTGAYKVDGLQGVEITTYAFGAGLLFPARVSQLVLMMCLTFFAFTTILGWDYYSERCLEYLTNRNMKAVSVYRWIYIFAVFIGPYLTVSLVWNIADIFNGLMALPNIIALLALSGVVARETREYFGKTKPKK